MPQITSIPHFGDVNQNVTIVQQALQQALKLTAFSIDGIFGNYTQKAIVKFQKLKGFEPVGYLGPKTLKALKLELITQSNNKGYAPLSWEFEQPERTAWSDVTYQIIDGLFDIKLSNCGDIKDFRTNFKTLNRQQKINVWSEIICRICYHESGWNPCSWMFESLGTDPVTGKQVKSEGLMQLSYQDLPNYPTLPCQFSWSNDKTLDQNDPNKTIFNPTYNLEFGINILAKQVQEKGTIALSSGVYWSVLKINGKYSKLPQIQNAVQLFKLV
jgi:peptidoglycan hydrolase-like protein with peptidoglycan-binding domain